MDIIIIINDFVKQYFGNWGILIQAIATYGAFITFSITLIISLITLIEDRKKRKIEFEFLYEQTKIQRDNLEATRTQNKLYLDLIGSKEDDPEQQKILDKIVAIEKEKRRKAIMPYFIVKNYSTNLLTFGLLNIGEQARNISAQISLEKGSPLGICDPRDYIEKNGLLRITLNVVTDKFSLFVIFEDIEGIKYFQVITLKENKLFINKPERYLVVQK